MLADATELAFVIRQSLQTYRVTFGRQTVHPANHRSRIRNGAGRIRKPFLLAKPLTPQGVTSRGAFFRADGWINQPARYGGQFQNRATHTHGAMVSIGSARARDNPMT